MSNEDWRSVRLDGKVVIVTGANSGIGSATACELARRGMLITLFSASWSNYTAR